MATTGLQINGKALVLPPDVLVRLDLLGGLLEKEFDDSFSMPFQIPIRGNEGVLGHINRVDLASYILSYNNATYIRDGLPLYPGTIKIFGSTDTHYSASFSVGGFTEAANNTPLSEVDFGDPIDVGLFLRDHAKTVNTGAYPDERYCFPMIHCPELIGSENPQWNPSAPLFDIGATYNEFDFVSYAPPSQPYTLFIYECLADGTTGFEPPDGPSDGNWVRRAFSVINHWDHVNEVFYENGPAADWGDPLEYLGGNFFTMAPMPYWKAVLQAACAHIGFTAAGAFMRDASYDRVCFWSNQLLDGSALAGRFRARATSPVTYTTSTSIDCVLPAHDDSSTGYYDPDGVWNTTTFRFTCIHEGVHFFEVQAMVNLKPGGYRVRVYEDGGTPIERYNQLAVYNIFGSQAYVNHQFNLSLDIADISKEFFFTVEAADLFYNDPLTLEDCVIRGGRYMDTYLTNLYTDTILLGQHMPDLSIAQFINATRDLFGIHLKPDASTRTLYFDYIDDTLQAAAEDLSTQRVAPIKLLHSTAVPGTTFRSQASDVKLADVTGMTRLDDIPNELSLPAAFAQNTYVVVTSSRKVFATTAYRTGELHWVHLGVLDPLVQVGPEANSVEVKPAFTAPAMDQVASNGEMFLVPRMSDVGTSSHFQNGKQVPSLKVFYYHGMVENDNAVPYPFASPYAYDHAGTLLPNVTELDTTSPIGTYQRHWRRLAEARASGIPAQTSFQLQPHQVVNKVHQQPLRIDHQRYLPMRFPLRLDNGPLLAEECELLLLKPTST